MKNLSLVRGRWWWAVLAVLGAAAALPSRAEEVDRHARVWASSCAACHGTDGRAAGAIPALAGRDGNVLYLTLLEFKNGQRPAATVMPQHARGYTDDELRRIALFFASRPAP